MYANIIIDIAHEKLDKTFQYRVPEELEDVLKIGMEVRVPFGRGNRERRGYIIGFDRQTDYDPAKIKPVLGVAEKSAAIESRLIELAAWIREQYGGTMIQALRTVLPVKKEEKAREKRVVRLLLAKEDAEEKLAWYRKKRQTARARILEGLIELPEQDYDLVTKKLNVTLKTLRQMEAQGVLVVESVRQMRNPIHDRAKKAKPVVFAPAQERAVSRFWEDYRKGNRGVYLLYGVTGSGKTEVYMEMIRRVVGMGKQAIVLIPEIALTYQTVLRFYGRFGDRVSILNSRLSPGERYDQMERVRQGEVDVMIGPRSALFTPFPRLGLIVVDEEHEGSYKSGQVPRYHARETAIARARLEDASVVLGSATPSLEAFYRCKTGESVLLELKDRAAEAVMPQVYIVDMREEPGKGNPSILSDRLAELMEDRLGKGQQMMLFLNRRGYAGFLSCRSCGYVVKCPHCDVSLAAHRGGRMVCHYCGYEEPQVRVCPSCGSRYMAGFRIGTQQMEEIVAKRFPDARTLRMDLDSTRKKDGHEKILSAFANEEADILIGTQMIVKGHDFPNVTLVGIVAADLSLYANDYCAAERTFQLLTQAAGRAGRGKEPGEVVIQTYNPEHYSIRMAARQDYDGFFEAEMRYRKLMGYPPVCHLLAVLMGGKDEGSLETAAFYLKEFALRASAGRQGRVIGPASPYVGKVKDEFRRLLYVKCEEEKKLIEIKGLMEQYIEINDGFKSLRIQFDWNPAGGF